MLRFVVACALVMLIGVGAAPTAAKNACTEMHTIKETTDALTVDDAETLIIPLMDGFTLDLHRCRGLTQDVIAAAQAALTKKKDELSGPLADVCNQAVSGRDLETIAAILAQKKAARVAIKHIQDVTILCDGNPVVGP